MRKIKFTRDVFVDGAKVHAVGDVCDLSSELDKHVRRGNAVETEVEKVKAARNAAKVKK